MDRKFILKTIFISLILTIFTYSYAFAGTEGSVTGNRVNVRTGPSTNSTIIDKYYVGQKVNIVSKEGDWYNIILPNNTSAYIFGEYVEIIEPTSDTNENASETVNDSNDTRTEIVKYAKKFLGNPYRYGGNSLTNGVDCSGFTQQIYKHFGYSINRSSSSQIQNGQAIKASELLPGDLVFYGYSGRISHVAIYIGDGKIIHASTSSSGIIISNLYDKGNKPYIGARRIV